MGMAAVAMAARAQGLEDAQIHGFAPQAFIETIHNYLGKDIGSGSPASTEPAANINRKSK
jgi:hypothetical protein